MLKENNPIREQQLGWSHKKEESINNLRNLKTKLQRTDRNRIKEFNLIETIKTEIEDLEHSLESKTKIELNRKNKLKRIELEFKNYSEELIEYENINEIKNNSLNNNKILNSKRRENTKLNNQILELNNSQDSLIRNKNKLNNELSNYQNTNVQLNNLIFKNRDRDRHFYGWVESNRLSMEGEIYGPIVKELELKNENYCNYLNNVLSQTILYGYVVTNSDTWNKLSQKSKEFGLSIQIIQQTLQNTNFNERRTVEREHLNKCGVDGWLDETFECPTLVKEVLCNFNNLHTIGICNSTITSNNLDLILRNSRNDRNVLQMLITSDTIWNVQMSRYEDTSAKISKKLKYFGNRGFIQIRKDYTSQITNLENTIHTLNNKIDSIELQKSSIKNELLIINKKIQTCNKIKEELNTKLNNYRQINTKIKRLEIKIKNSSEGINIKELKEEISFKILDLNKTRIKTIVKQIQYFKTFNELLKKQTLNEIITKHCTLEMESLKKKINKSKNIKDKLENDIRGLRSEIMDLQTEVLEFKKRRRI